MARHRSQSEKTMHAVQDKAEEQLYAQYSEQRPQEILPSWSHGELILDVRFEDPLGWKRFAYVPDDDLEIAGVRELA